MLLAHLKQCKCLAQETILVDISLTSKLQHQEINKLCETVSTNKSL